MKNQKGFTLIELLLVLAIIGIISAIAIPALLGQRENARNRATESNASNIRGALVSAVGALGLPAAQRPADLDAATTVADVIAALDARVEYNLMRSPWNGDAEAYDFTGLVTVDEADIGQVGMLERLNEDTGLPEIAINYNTRVKGVYAITEISPVDAAQ